MLKSYFKIAWRNLLQNKGLSFINIFGLAIGMAFAMLIGLWIQFETSFDQFHKNKDRIAQVMKHSLFNKEIGIRKVLGASVTNLWMLLSKEFVLLVLAAVIIASPRAWWLMHDWLQQYDYRIDISGWIFALAGLLALVIALFTVSTQAIRAALANPVKSLRTE